jgi:hypothetical protein
MQPNRSDTGAVRGPQTPPATRQPEPALYTRYCAAPQPAHPIGEPTLIHALLVAAWLGRIIDPLPHAKRRA